MNLATSDYKEIGIILYSLYNKRSNKNKDQFIQYNDKLGIFYTNNFNKILMAWIITEKIFDSETNFVTNNPGYIEYIRRLK